MTERVLTPVPVTAERFAPFGDVIHAGPGSVQAMNEARFERFDDLARIDVDQNRGGHVAISIARSKTPTQLPHRFSLVERHPLGSQAFIPLSPFAFIVVVAAAEETVGPEDLCAFVTNGSQGINYHRGVWHMPLIATERNQSFLVVDRAPGTNNCEELVLSAALVLRAP